jgi:PAS domain S-box-containing protein
MQLPFSVLSRKDYDRLCYEAENLKKESLHATEFIRNIEAGNIETAQDEEMAKSAGKSQLLAALLKMQEQLKTIAKDEKQRKWATEGLTQFVEILRSQHAEASQLYNSIIANLVKYLQANQGGLFIVNQDREDRIFLEMQACYAYERKKYLHQRINVGEGLVGQCYLEADTIYISDVPENYVNITSGLGEATPRNILIVPLKLNDKIYGVVELAGFNVFEPHQIAFVEKLGESIAATISNTQVSHKTQELLEIAQQQAEEMKAAEEEMRQNMEELEATQEEMKRKDVEITGIFTAIDTTLATIEFDMDGKVLTANQNFLKLMGYNLEEIRGRHHEIFVNPEYAKSEEYAKLWQDLRHNKTKIDDIQRYTKTGEAVWLRASYTPVQDAEGNYYKIIKLGQDITEKKHAELEFQRLSLVANNTDNSVIITNKEGCIEYVNNGFERMTGYTLAEVQGKKPGSFLQGADTDKKTVQRIREKLNAQEPFYEEILNYTREGETYWISLAINPIIDKKGRLEKYVAIQANITESKLKNLDYNYRLDAIDKSYGVVAFDTEGNILEANANFLAIVGYTLEEIQGKHHQMFVDEIERNSPAYKEFWGSLGKKGEFISGEFKRIAKNGETVWLKGSYNAILNLQGKPYKVVKYAQNVTAQKALEAQAHQQMEEIQAQEEELRQNMEELTATQEEIERKAIELNGVRAAINITMATIEFDLNGTILTANAKFLNLMGYDIDEISGKHHRIFLDTDYARSKAYVKFWDDLNFGKAQIEEVRRIAEDGREVWLSATYTPILDAQGNPFKVIKFAQDITAQKQRTMDFESQLEAIHKAYSVVEFDPRGNVMAANENFLTLMNYGINEIKGRHHRVFVATEEADSKDYQHFWSSLANGESLNGEFVRYGKNGSEVLIRGSYSPIRDLNGKVYKVVEYAQHIARQSGVKQINLRKPNPQEMGVS